MWAKSGWMWQWKKTGCTVVGSEGRRRKTTKSQRVWKRRKRTTTTISRILPFSSSCNSFSFLSLSSLLSFLSIYSFLSTFLSSPKVRFCVLSQRAILQMGGGGKFYSKKVFFAMCQRRVRLTFLFFDVFFFCFHSPRDKSETRKEDIPSSFLILFSSPLSSLGPLNTFSPFSFRWPSLS